MLYGVKINGTDTLMEYGLILCADLKISEPRLKENRIDIPGGDGSLNMSYAPQGIAVYYDREITFTLFKAMGEEERDELVTTLRNAWHGLEVSLILPNDTTHYWHGVIGFGEISGYNEGKIPVKMTAGPYKLKNTLTSVTQEGAGSVILENERRPVTPLISSTGSATLTWDGYSVAIGAGEVTVPQLVLSPGENEITVAGSATVTFTYREGSL